MKTKEEILDKAEKALEGWRSGRDIVEDAMDEYAKQQAIAFETWRRLEDRKGNTEIFGKTPEELYAQFESQTPPKQ